MENIAIMHGEAEFSKSKRSISNIPIDAENISNLFPKAAFSNRVIIVKLKRELKYRSHLYFGSVCPNIMNKRLLIWKLIANYMKIFLLQRVPQVRTCSGFQNCWNSCYWKNNFRWEKMKQNMNDMEIEYASVEDSLNIQRSVSNEKTLIFKIPNIINKDNVKKPV